MSFAANSFTQSLTDQRVAVWPTPIFPQAEIPALIQDPVTGAVYVNPRKRTAAWTYLGGDPDTITLAANGQSVFTFRPGLEGESGDMEIVKLSFTCSTGGRFGVILEDANTQRKYMNTWVSNHMVMGNGRFPFSLYETIYVPATSNLLVHVRDLSGAPNVIKVVAEGRKFFGCGSRQQLAQAFNNRRSHPYWLTFDAGPEQIITANTRTIRTMTVPNNADFVCWSIMDDSDDGAGVFTTDYMIKLTEGQFGQSLMVMGQGANGQSAGLTECKQHVASSIYTETPALGNDVLLWRPNFNPHRWTYTHTFKRGTQIQVEMMRTLVNHTVRLGLHGQLVYYDNPPTC